MRIPYLRDRAERASGTSPWWLLSAVGMWATRNRAARRAALRGLVGAGISAALARVLRRGSPSIDPGAAAATAFAGGAALEAPLAGLAAAAAGGPALTAAVKDGRTAGLAAAVTVGVRRIWPVPPAGGPEVPKVTLPGHADASPDGGGLFVAVNTASGNGAAPTEALEQELPGAVVEEVEIDRGDELRKALDGGAEDAVALGVSGGDGSINTAAQVALDQEKPLAVFPSGTFNHLAGALELDSAEDTLAAIRSGEAVEVDAATIDGHVFVNTASFGAYAELVDMREKLEKRLGKWPAVVVALVRVLRHSRPVAVEIDGRPVKVWMAFIGNCRYSPSGFAPSWRRRLDDEQIDFRYVDGSSPLARTRLVIAVLTGRLASCKVYEQLVVKELRIRSLQGPLRLARDGETFMSSSDEIVVRKLPQRLAVYCPHEQVG